MFKHLLVPLDGSPLAEEALGPATFIARKTGARVTLLHSLEDRAPHQVHGTRHLTQADEGQAYLQEKASHELAGLTVECHVHDERVRDVSRSIAEHAGELTPDLIVMCAHGDASLRDRLFGGVAQRVVRPGQTPVLLIRPGAAPAQGFRKFLVPDDGSQDHEPGLEICAQLALVFEARIHLVRVVETLSTLGGAQGAASQFLPAAARLMLEMSEAEAVQHLEENIQQIRARGVQAAGEVRRGDPATVLVQAAREKEADLLVVRTHGKTGTDAFWSGSLTPRLYGATHLPMLLVPVPSD